MSKVSIYTDGGSRGNPGTAGIGIIGYNENNDIVFKISQYIGKQTNNVSEYKALVRALEIVVEKEIKDIEIFMDSQLVVRQIKGEYKVRNERMKPFYEMAISLIRNIDNFNINHVKRSENSEADKLANEAMDSKKLNINYYW